MYRPQNLVAALFSAALLCTTGIALADKGGNHDKHGGSSHGPSAPGQSTNSGPQAGPQRGPGGIGGPQSGPGSFDRDMSRHSRTSGDGSRGSEFEGSVDDRDASGSGGAKAAVTVKLSNGSTHAFAISGAALASLKDHSGRRDLIFFTIDGKEITAISAPGEKDDMRVTARSGNTFTLQDQSGQVRLITLDARTANRLHVKVGSSVEVVAMTATRGRIVALDLVKKHDFDKFARGLRNDVDVDVAKTDLDRAKADVDVAKAKKAKKADIDDVDTDIDAVKTDIDTAKGKKSKKLDIDVAKLDNDDRKLDVDVAKAKKTDVDVDVDVDVAKTDIDRAKIDVDVARAKKAKKADIDVVKADIDTVKTDIDTAKGKKSKKLDVDVAKLDIDDHKLDVDVAMGACGHGSSRNGNPAFANQMAKDAANDASGHNPPGLPHECVNPAGNTRGFCKSSSSESICSTAGGSGGGENEVASNGSPSKPCAPGTSSRNRSNPAFANQMAKDAANDASGHNPPGLPHECVNPAGHTRGFCKTAQSESSAMCGSSGSGGVTPSELHGGIASAPVPGTRNAPVNGSASAPINSGSGNGGNRNVGVPARGFAPGGTVNSASGSGGSRNAGIASARGFAPSGTGTRGRGTAGAPTHVLGAATGPGAARHVAALPTRVLPVAIQPVGKRRCVWYKTGVLAASTGPHYIIGTSAIRGKPLLHKKCR